jgi:lycopene cyclase CruA
VSARDRVRDAGGAELLERLEHLDTPILPDEPIPAPDRGARTDFDVIFAGGGLSLLIAASLARRGARVCVIDRARAGSGHREWNASRGELEALVRGKILTREELEELIVARYDHGICAFHGGGRYPVKDVLDHAVDAGPLLERVRAKAPFITFLDGTAVTGIGPGRDAIAVRAGNQVLTARWMVDARGSRSPYATADLVCPTVGGVVEGLEMDPRVGEILVTVDDAEEGRQYVWEGFPGRPGQTTVYLFHYTRRRGSLLELYARFFDKLATYKRGAARLVRPTFGFIPGWSRLAPAPKPPPRVVLVGDAAARHSPLTMCGFGAMLRSFDAAAEVLAADRPAEVLAHDARIHAGTGGMAALMASETLKGGQMNALLDAAFASLHAMGQEPYANLLKDRMSASELVSFLRRTARLHPTVYREVLRALGGGRSLHWGTNLVFGA